MAAGVQLVGGKVAEAAVGARRLFEAERDPEDIAQGVLEGVVVGALGLEGGERAEPARAFPQYAFPDAGDPLWSGMVAYFDDAQVHIISYHACLLCKGCGLMGCSRRPLCVRR